MKTLVTLLFALTAFSSFAAERGMSPNPENLVCRTSSLVRDNGVEVILSRTYHGTVELTSAKVNQITFFGTETIGDYLVDSRYAFDSSYYFDKKTQGKEFSLSVNYRTESQGVYTALLTVDSKAGRLHETLSCKPLRQ